MAKDYSGRVNALKARRQGLNTTKSIEKSLTANTYSLEALVEDARNLAQEEYETRTNSTALKYALGAMQQVDDKYTSISIQEANRISSQVIDGLSQMGDSATAELQGSLPINVHLRRVSDVDILILPEYFIRYAVYGSRSGNYTPSSTSAPQEILRLRGNCVKILGTAYYAANVDDSGAKCISITGGSLRRDVDVVPALWFDSVDYQASLRKPDRAVQVYDKYAGDFSTNYPFRVQENINQKDLQTNGGCKKSIRLLKTLKSDADHNINLSSFDIMSIVFAMENGKLNHHKLYEGVLILSVKDWLGYLVDNPDYMRSLESVDRSRKIISSREAEEGVGSLYQEINELVERIQEEMSPYDYEKRPQVLRDMIF
ncbi:hypothetical protein ACXHWJ_08760 [Alcaligenes nematophilus]